MIKKIVKFFKNKKVLLVILLIVLLYCCNCKFFMDSEEKIKENKIKENNKKMAKIQQRMQVDLIQTIKSDISELSQAPQLMPTADEIVAMIE